MKELASLIKNNGFLFLTLNMLLSLFGFSFIPLFLKEQGYSLWQLVFLYVIYTALASLFIMFVSVFRIKIFLILGFVLQALVALLFWFYPPSTLYLYALLLGLIAIFYWIPLNWLFFQQTQRTTNATQSSLYYLVSGLISVLLPPLGALVVHSWGYRWLFGITTVLYLIPLFLAYKLVAEKYEQAPFWVGFHKFKGLRTITFCEGALHFYGGAIVPIYGLLFLKTEGDIGFYLSYLGALGVILALLLSRRSDASQKRKSYLFVLFLLMAIAISGMILVRTRWQFYLVVGVFTIISTLSSPIRLAVSMDVKTVDVSFWKMREFCLNVGRATTLSLAAFLFYKELYVPVFVLYGIIALIYPFLVRYKWKTLQ